MIFIQLDPEGTPHWLLDKGRAWLRWFLRQQRDRKESAAFYAKHGPVVITEPNNNGREQ